MKRLILLVAVVGLLVTAGCAEPDSSDYGDAPEEVRDGSLDYQDYKEAGCPYLDGALDHETMQKCNEWLRNQNSTTNATD